VKVSRYGFPVAAHGILNFEAFEWFGIAVGENSLPRSPKIGANLEWRFSEDLKTKRQIMPRIELAPEPDQRLNF
jgi:hypothetical protein